MIYSYDNPIAQHDSYSTPSVTNHGAYMASLIAYTKIFGVVWRSSKQAKKGVYGSREWVDNSAAILRALESSGVSVHIDGMRHLRATEVPAVITANHMSTLETFVLPMIIQPVKPCTFVIKPSLMDYPVFGPVMRSRNPIVVSRDNPRKDLVTVLEEGKAKLEQGISVILFPQTTRRVDFVADEFNSLGVKLAKAANCPVLPLALKTDAWGNGRFVKEFGRINPALPVRFSFHEPVYVTGNGKTEHQQVVSFIESKLKEWG